MRVFKVAAAVAPMIAFIVLAPKLADVAPGTEDERRVRAERENVAAITNLRRANQPGILIAQLKLAEALEHAGHAIEADDIVRDVIARLDQISTLPAREKLAFTDIASQVTGNMEKLEATEHLLRLQFDAARQNFGDAHRESLTTGVALARYLAKCGKLNGAAALYERIIALADATGNLNERTVNRCELQLVAILEKHGSYDKVETVCRRYQQRLETDPDSSSSDRIGAALPFARFLKRRGRISESIAITKQMLARMDAEKITSGIDFGAAKALLRSLEVMEAASLLGTATAYGPQNAGSSDELSARR